MSPRSRPAAAPIGVAIVALAIGLSAVAAPAIAIGLGRLAPASPTVAVPAPDASARGARGLDGPVPAVAPASPVVADPPSDPIVAELPPVGGEPLPSLAPAAAAPVATLPPDGSVRGPGDTARLPTRAGGPNAPGGIASPTVLAGLAVLVVIVLTSLVGGILAAGRGRR